MIVIANCSFVIIFLMVCLCIPQHYTLATRMAQVKFELYSEGDDIEDYLE